MYDFDQIVEGVTNLDDLCQEEYGQGLVQLLGDSDEQLAARRLRRLTGVTLKMEFAEPTPIGSVPSESGALRYWTWDEKLAKGEVRDPSNPNYVVLDQLREALPTLDPSYEWRDASWPHLVEEAEHESGLFRVLACWVDDKLSGRETSSFREYFVGDASLNVGTTADVAETVFNHAMAPVFAAFIPGAGLVVPLILVGARFGLTRMLEGLQRTRRP